MNRYQLVCKPENIAIFTAILEANHLTVDKDSTIVLCEEGVKCTYDYDILVCFKKDKIADLIDLLKGQTKTNPKMILGKIDDSYVPLDIDNIVYFNAYGNDTFANTLSGQSYKVKYKLYKLEEEILPKQFIRINKSEIVQIKHIIRIIPMFKGKLILKIEGYKQPIDISRNYVDNFKERIGI